MRFAKNSSHDAPSGCPHPVLRYVVDAQWHTVACERCGDHWSLIGPRTTPRYTDNGLINPAERDKRYPDDKCVPPMEIGKGKSE